MFILYTHAVRMQEMADCNKTKKKNNIGVEFLQDWHEIFFTIKPT